MSTSKQIKEWKEKKFGRVMTEEELMNYQMGADPSSLCIYYLHWSRLGYAGDLSVSSVIN